MVVVFAMAPGHAANLEEKPSITHRLRQMVEPYGSGGLPAAAILEVEDVQVSLHGALVPFYRGRNYRPAWFDADGKFSVIAWQWLQRLQGVAAEGLDPLDYHVESLTVSVETVQVSHSFGEECDTVGLALIDLLLTDSFLKYASRLLYGQVHAARWYAGDSRIPAAEAVSVMHRVMQQRQVDPVLEALVPERVGYRRLAVYLAHYRNLASAGVWPTLADGPSVSPGKSDQRVPRLRRFLMLVGDLDTGRMSAGPGMDVDTVAALRRFQSRHGLRPDGVLGPETLAQINVPVEKRIEQLTLNLERERLQKPASGSRYLQVDITDFNLTVFENGLEVMAMPVVVGTSFRRTPVFSALMSYLVFAPYWTVPPTILKQDKLPLIKADPGYLASHHYEIVAWGKDPDRIIDPGKIDWKKITAETFPGMLRQKPGPWNPLGKVKFMFPNAYHVYLHDTPSRHLFEKQQRTFSSGCIRIARPVDLAVYLLGGQEGWDRGRILKEMERSKPYTVRLKRPLPVHILYRTAWVDAWGRLQFRNDVYGRDPELKTVLDEQNRVAKKKTGMAARGSADSHATDGVAETVVR